MDTTIEETTETVTTAIPVLLLTQAEADKIISSMGGTAIATATFYATNGVSTEFKVVVQ